MKDINLPLRKAYTTALSGMVVDGNTVKVYYQMAPDDVADPVYIVLSNVSSTDNSTFYKANLITGFQVAIRTFKAKYNDGELADQVANEIFARVYPDQQTVLDLTADGIQLYDTWLTTDFVQDYGLKNNRVYLDRILQFQHRLFIRN